jgi:hypothetical protein
MHSGSKAGQGRTQSTGQGKGGILGVLTGGLGAGWPRGAGLSPGLRFDGS